MGLTGHDNLTIYCNVDTMGTNSTFFLVLYQDGTISYSKPRPMAGDRCYISPTLTSVVRYSLSSLCAVSFSVRVPLLAPQGSGC